MRRVAVVGVGCTKVGELWDKSLKDLAVESATKALDDAGVERVDFVYVGNAYSQILQSQGNLGSFIVDSLGFNGTPSISIEAADSSGSLAFHEAYKAVKLGWANYVLVVGVEKMSDSTPEEVAKALMACEDQDYVAFTGITQAGLHALVLRLYMERFRIKHEDVAMFTVKAHKNALNNPYAQFKNPLSVEDVLKSPILADPLRLLEYTTIADGSAALILCPLEEAKKITDKPVVEVLGSASATDKFYLPERIDSLTFNATVEAAKKAFQEAKISIDKVDFIETHDNSTIMGVISIEDLGFAEKGRGTTFIVEEKIPINTMGGSKGRGHPIGATGVYQLVEAVWQLRGEAGKNQVKDAKIGLTHTLTGIGNLAAVNILGCL